MEYLNLKADSRTADQALFGVLNPKSAEDKKYCRYLLKNYSIIEQNKSTKTYTIIDSKFNCYAVFTNNITSRKENYFKKMQEFLQELRKTKKRIKIVVD